MQSSSEQGTKIQRSPSARLTRTNGEHNVGDAERVVSSVVGGALLLSALRTPTPGSAARLLGATALLHRGVTGHCYLYSAMGRSTAGSSLERAAVQQSITIGKSPEELYRFWQEPKNMSAIMKDFAQVEDAGGGRWRWTVSFPGARKLSWTTSPTAQRPGELIAWRTEADAPFVHEGSLRLRKAPRDLGTEVTLSMSFGAEHGPLRKLTGRLFKTIPRALEETILRHAKSLIEAGEIPSLEHNPDARTRSLPERKPKPQRIASQSVTTSTARSMS